MNAHQIMFGVEARLIQVGIFFSLGFLIEGLATADEANTARNVFFNVSYSVFYNTLDMTLGFAFGTFVESFVKRAPFSGFISLAVTDGGKFWLALVLAFANLAIYDFFYYWFHRLEHRSRWLWSVHEFHHSDEHLNVTTTNRHHWLELPLTSFFISAPLVLLFKPPIVTIGLAILVARGMGFFVHSNSRIGFGPFSRFMANPQVHRIHHSKLPQHFDRNFAAFFPFWDVIFGTYYHAQQGEYPPTGLASGRTVYSFREAISMPFVTWRKMLKAHGSVPAGELQGQ